MMAMLLQMSFLSALVWEGIIGRIDIRPFLCFIMATRALTAAGLLDFSPVAFSRRGGLKMAKYSWQYWMTGTDRLEIAIQNRMDVTRAPAFYLEEFTTNLDFS